MQSHGNSSKPWRSAAGERRAWKIQSFRTNIQRGKIMILWCISLSIFNNTYIPRAYIKDMPNFQCSDVLRNLFEFYAGCYNMHTVSIFGTGTLWPNHYCTYHIVSMWLMACMRIICHICAAMATETGFQLIWKKKALAGRLLAWLLNSTHFVNGIFFVHRLSGIQHAVVIHSEEDEVRFHASNSMRKPIFIDSDFRWDHYVRMVCSEWIRSVFP